MIKKLMRLCIYLLGIVVVLSLLGIGVFYLAKPYIGTFAEQKLANYKIKAESSQVALPGKLVMNNVTLPTPDGINVHAGTIAARPPLPFFPGAATINDLRIQYNNIVVVIPTLDIGGISENNKDMTTDSKVLQNLSRFNISSLSIPEIKATLLDAEGKTNTITISGFTLSGLSHGKIGYIGVSDVNTDLSLNNAMRGVKDDRSLESINSIIDSSDGSTMQINAKTGAMSVRNLDLAYGYALFSGRPTKQKDNLIFGNVNLSKIVFDITGHDNENFNFTLGQLKSDGLRMVPPADFPENMLHAILTAKKSGDKNAEKEAIKHFIITMLGVTRAIDVDISGVVVKAPHVNVSLNGLRIKPDHWENNLPLPQQMQFSMSKLSFGGATLPGEAGELLQMFGLNTFDISAQANYRYNAGKKALDIEDMSFATGDLATGSLKAKIINVDKDIFTAQPEALIGAINTIGMSEMNIQYQDNGLIDHMFDYLSKDIQPSNPVAMKKELYDDLKLMLVKSAESLLKDHNNMPKIADTLGRFADKPGKLDISMKAKDNRGLTFNDIANTTGGENQDGLSQLLKKVDLTVNER